MNYGLKFRNSLLEEKQEFKKIFKTLEAKQLIEDFPKELFDVIKKHKSPIEINGKRLSFLEVFKENLNDGRCRECALELTLLLDRLGYKIRLVQGRNKFFKNTTNSYFGGHYWLEIIIGGRKRVVDTSLMIMADDDTIKLIGHEVIKKHIIDDLCKNPSILDYYESIVID